MSYQPLGRKPADAVRNRKDEEQDEEPDGEQVEDQPPRKNPYNYRTQTNQYNKWNRDNRSRNPPRLPGYPLKNNEREPESEPENGQGNIMASLFSDGTLDNVQVIMSVKELRELLESVVNGA